MRKENYESERFKELGRLTASVGHDLRSPLQAMMNLAYYIGIMAEGTILPSELSDLPKLATQIRKEVDYMVGIIDDISDLSKNVGVKIKPVDLNSLLEDAVSKVGFPSDIRVSLRTDIRDYVMLDGPMFLRVLVNLIMNAVQAMPKGGDLSVSASSQGGMIVIEVKDTGVGIPEENMGRLFEPLFTTKPQGTGLGLSVCKRIVEAHGGKIKVASEVGKGTTFSIEIPEAT